MIEIYALCDPDDGTIKYVGKAVCSKKRLKSHLRDSRRRNTPVYQWIRSLEKAPELKVLEVVFEYEWKDAERRWIEEYRGQILNLAKGGNEPFCPLEVRAENGRNNAAKRDYEMWRLKKAIGENFKRGYASEKAKEIMRSRPDLFAQFGEYL